MTHATVEEASSWAPSVRRWFDHEPALTGLCLVRAQHRQAGLAPRQPVFYRVEFDVESLLKGSNPLPGNDAKVRELLAQSPRRRCCRGIELKRRMNRRRDQPSPARSTWGPGLGPCRADSRSGLPGLIVLDQGRSN